MSERERDKVVKNWNFERENTITEDKWRDTWNVNFIHLKNNGLFNFKNYLKIYGIMLSFVGLSVCLASLFFANLFYYLTYFCYYL